MAKIKCDIRKMIGTLGEPDNSNKQPVVAIVSWNDGDEKVNIRHQNIVDGMLLKGISLSFEETTQLIYRLLGSEDIEYDPDMAIQLIQNHISQRQKNSKDDVPSDEDEVDISQLMMSLDLEDKPYARTESGHIKLVRRR